MQPCWLITPLANHATWLGRVELGAKKAGRTFEGFTLNLGVSMWPVHESGEVARTAVAPIILSAMRASYPSLEYLADLPEFELPSKLLSVMGRKDLQDAQLLCGCAAQRSQQGLSILLFSSSPLRYH